MLRAAGVELVEMVGADTCCGSAGTQLITHYHTSTAVLDRKMENAAATEAEFIASGCPGCQMQLTLGTKRRGMKARVVHPSQLLAEAYRNGDLTGPEDLSGLTGDENMIDKRILKELEGIVGKQHVLTSPEDLVAYSYDGTFAEHRPEFVVQPDSTEQVSAVLKVAYREGIPVVPRGMASGLAAASVPFSGGMALDTCRMNRILEIDEVNFTVTAQAGVITQILADTVAKKGLFYPPDPSSIKQSTLGGNAACNAGGPRCLKYGVTSDYVRGLTIVLADGRILRDGRQGHQERDRLQPDPALRRLRGDAGRHHRADPQADPPAQGGAHGQGGLSQAGRCQPLRQRRSSLPASRRPPSS